MERTGHMERTDVEKNKINYISEVNWRMGWEKLRVKWSL